MFQVDKRLAIFTGILIFILGFLLLPLNRYKDILFLRNEYSVATKKLVKSYNDYILQRKNFKKIQASLDRSVDISELRSLLPHSVRANFDEKNNIIHVEGTIPPKDVYKLLSLVTTTSNLRFEKLHIKNPIAIPITVSSSAMSAMINVVCDIKYLEVRR